MRAPRPFELRWLELEPEPWRASDSLAIARLRAWNLGRSLGASLLLDRLVSELGGVPSRDFFPVRPSDGAHDPLAPLLELGRSADSLAETAGLAGPAGSLGFVVPGVALGERQAARSRTTRTSTSARPPCSTSRTCARGASSCRARPGRACPCSSSGTNKTIAWGQVALHASVSDLFEETLDPAEPRRYERAGRWRKATLRREEIAVRDAAPVQIEIALTEHGPLLRSVRPDDSRASALALRWTGFAASERRRQRAAAAALRRLGVLPRRAARAARARGDVPLRRRRGRDRHAGRGRPAGPLDRHGAPARVGRVALLRLEGLDPVRGAAVDVRAERRGAGRVVASRRRRASATR